MENRLNEAIKNASLAIEEFANTLNNFTENQTTEELVELFKFHNVLELHESFDYYHKREMYRCCEAIKIVIDNNVKRLTE